MRSQRSPMRYIHTHTNILGRGGDETRRDETSRRRERESDETEVPNHVRALLDCLRRVVASQLVHPCTIHMGDDSAS
jgi:hypothetical protein